MVEIGIVGGGPGGLMAARFFAEKCPGLATISVLEASARFGGKLVTRRFAQSQAPYPAGVAEIYDYTALGPDPLAKLIKDLGLASTPMGSRTFVFGERVLPDMAAFEAAFGAATRREIEDFQRLCAATISPGQYYEGRTDTPELRALAKMNGLELIERHVRDDHARRFLRAAAHSDIAAPLHLTNALNAMRNMLMDVDGYIELRAIDGGVQRLADALVEDLQARQAAELVTGFAAAKIGRTAEGRYRVTASDARAREFDILVVALPLAALAVLEWEGKTLDAAMARHIRHFDRPGHYVRVSVRFERAFWRDHIAADWWISDAFGGCCVYDDSGRAGKSDAAVLGWLIAGNAALAMANLDDADIVAQALASLPPALREGAALQREAAVHRWLSSVNAVPGGLVERDLFANHVPEPTAHPALYMVGDYLFDSTINAVLDSADAASDLALDALARCLAGKAKPAKRIGAKYFSNYRGLGAYEKNWQRFLDAPTIKKLAQAAFACGENFSILDAGSASGLLVAALRAENIDAWGAENNPAIHAQTPAQTVPYNRLCDMRDLPFVDGQFDIVYETCLAHVSDADLEDALFELRRVARRGVILGSPSADMALALRGKFDLLSGVPRLRTNWEWQELMRDAGFVPAIGDDATAALLFAAVTAAGFGPGAWFASAQSLRERLFVGVG
jgi:monoamine oxidase/SAM-dependent methyltransferase